MKESIIKLTDVNVDGCGTNVETVLKVTGPDLTNGVTQRVSEAIARYKELDEEWDMDGCLNAAEAQLKEEGYEVEYVTPEIEIEF